MNACFGSSYDESITHSILGLVLYSPFFAKYDFCHPVRIHIVTELVMTNFSNKPCMIFLMFYPDFLNIWFSKAQKPKVNFTVSAVY